jgi:hypothetical protein
MKIERIEWNNPVCTVYWTPNWLERLFKVKPKKVNYIDHGRIYVFGGQWKWFNEDGSVYGRFEELDNYIRSIKYKAS